MLAIWEYFWDWAGAPTPAPTPTPVTPGRGSGGKSHAQDNYLTLPEEYWEARANQTAPQKVSPEILQERRKRLLREVRQIIEEQQQVTALRKEHETILSALRNTTSLDTLKTLSEQSKVLKNQLAELETTNKARIIRAQMLRESLTH